MIRYTRRELKKLASSGEARDISEFRFKACEALVDSEGSFTKIGYSAGLYGINGGVMKGDSSGALYVIIGRTMSLLYFF